MPILIRLAGSGPLPVSIVKLLQEAPEAYELECWAALDFQCPRCQTIASVRAGDLGQRLLCAGCRSPFWCRVVRGPSLVTSTDDPSAR